MQQMMPLYIDISFDFVNNIFLKMLFCFFFFKCYFCLSINSSDWLGNQYPLTFSPPGCPQLSLSLHDFLLVDDSPYECAAVATDAVTGGKVTVIVTEIVTALINQSDWTNQTLFVIYLTFLF